MKSKYQENIYLMDFNVPDKKLCRQIRQQFFAFLGENKSGKYKTCTSCGKNPTIFQSRFFCEQCSSQWAGMWVNNWDCQSKINKAAIKAMPK